MANALFLINPVTAKTILTPHLIEILDLLQKHGIRTQVHITQAKGDAESTAAGLGGQFDLILCAGGDGTLNETVSGVMQIPGSKPAIGYIPSGTTNDFAAGWGISLNPSEAVQKIVSADPVPLDVCLFRGKPYVYVAAFGAFTKVSYSTSQQMKQTLGWAAYVLEGIKSLSDLRPCRMKIEYDGGETSGEFLFGMFSNTRSVGGFPLKQKDDISISDGLMEVILIRNPASTLDQPKLLGAVLTQDISSEYIEFLHTRHLRFTAEDELPWTVDGEFGGNWQEGEISVVPSPLRMYL